MTKKWRRLFSVVSSVIFAVAIFSPAFAAESSLKITPDIKQIELKKNETKKQEIVVENSSDKVAKVKLSIAPYIVKNEDYEVSFSESERDDSSEILDWIKFKDENGEYKKSLEFKLQPKEKKTVAYKISAPEFEKEQRAIIFAETENDSNAVVRVASLLVVSLDGSVFSPIIEEIKSSSGLSDENIFSEITIKNGGDKYAEIEAKFSVETIFGKKLKEEERKNLVFSGTTRKISFHWEESPNFGIYKVKTTVNSEEKTSIVFVLPFSEEILPILVLTFIIFMLIMKSRNRKECGDSFDKINKKEQK